MPKEHRKKNSVVRKKYQKHGPEISGWICNCEISLHTHQKAPKHYAYEEAENVAKGRMYCLDLSKRHQLVSESLLKGMKST
jgi:hypothetical protein